MIITVTTVCTQARRSKKNHISLDSPIRTVLVYQDMSSTPKGPTIESRNTSSVGILTGYRALDDGNVDATLVVSCRVKNVVCLIYSRGK